MASGAFNAKAALLLTPLVSSTASLVLAWDHHIFLSVFTRRETQAHSNAILPQYWRVFFPRGLTQVISLLGVTTSASVAAVVAYRGLLQRRGALRWYVATAALAVGHLVFAPLVAGPIKSMLDDEGGEGKGKGEGEGRTNVDAQREWLRVNVVRMLTADLGAWQLCQQLCQKLALE
ncbi:hypothetical protein TOPH_01553 [Tolypocladium ophioglossoides CBS 100239]|uniref:Integral membrane protein n=1 Tax=Tolypocladium ophioglossoides (strain CBS 100239) TaxID=1163406 RepID=A0A0L0NHP6_TOLOC|nr:hypothetical protein TOPH_01553 [Tolypocladium ophioglossoides CBS 100239]